MKACKLGGSLPFKVIYTEGKSYKKHKISTKIKVSAKNIQETLLKH